MQWHDLGHRSLCAGFFSEMIRRVTQVQNGGTVSSAQKRDLTGIGGYFVRSKLDRRRGHSDTYLINRLRGLTKLLEGVYGYDLNWLGSYPYVEKRTVEV